MSLKVEQILLKRCVANESKAQYELYKICYSCLMSICMRYYVNNEDARATLNLGFLKILQSLEKNLNMINSFEAWIRKLMIHTIIDEHRKNKNYKESHHFPDNEIEHDDDFKDENDGEEKLNADCLNAMIHQLKPTEASVFNLFAIDGFSHDEISEMMSIPAGTSKWLLSEARKKLRQKIEVELKKNYSVI